MWYNYKSCKVILYVVVSKYFIEILLKEKDGEEEFN
jgi:hypothetical protein